MQQAGEVGDRRCARWLPETAYFYQIRYGKDVWETL